MKKKEMTTTHWSIPSDLNFQAEFPTKLAKLTLEKNDRAELKQLKYGENVLKETQPEAV